MNQHTPLSSGINQFISVDWGTSNLRVRLVNLLDLQVAKELWFPKGIKNIYQEWKVSSEDREHFYLRYLNHCLKQVAPLFHSQMPVVVSGMASSNIGIRELPYAHIPFGNNGSELYVEQIESTELAYPLLLISGVQTANDVIRGEEVQIIGLMSGRTASSQLYILPGTHSKHILVEEGNVVDFKTYMTGELFDVIEKYTVLSNSIQCAEMGKAETRAFVGGVQQAIEIGSLLQNLFKVRTNVLLHDLSSTENYYFLSGLVIGEELRNLKTRKHLKVNLCAGGILSDLYQLAIEALELQEQTVIINNENIDNAVIRGQWIILNHYLNKKYEKV